SPDLCCDARRARGLICPLLTPEKATGYPAAELSAPRFTSVDARANAPVSTPSLALPRRHSSHHSSHREHQQPANHRRDEQRQRSLTEQSRHLLKLLRIDVPSDQSRNQIAERRRHEPDAHHLALELEGGKLGHRAETHRTQR